MIMLFLGLTVLLHIGGWSKETEVHNVCLSIYFTSNHVFIAVMYFDCLVDWVLYQQINMLNIFELVA